MSGLRVRCVGGCRCGWVMVMCVSVSGVDRE